MKENGGGMKDASTCQRQEQEKVKKQKSSQRIIGRILLGLSSIWLNYLKIYSRNGDCLILRKEISDIVQVKIQIENSFDLKCNTWFSNIEK